MVLINNIIIKSVECMHDNTIRLYKNGLHSNKYPEETDIRKISGIHYFYKEEINKLLADEAGKTPFAILKVITKRLADKCPGYDPSYPLPTLAQIRNYKRSNGPTASYNSEYDQVLALINQLSYTSDEPDDKKAFTYGIKMGTGADNDPFIVCFTSRHLLSNISKYSNHYSVFHIDGTYKNIKNRFPVIAYGRSDSNGQLHLISVAIVSDEKTETYTHFYRYLIGFIHLIG